jgi:hypothetical protein
LFVFHAIYGLEVVSDLPLPGLAVCDEQGPFDLRILLKERKKFASKFSASLSHVFYTSPHTDGDGESILQVGTPGDRRYIGFYYSDGARFAIEHQGREIWADWPDNYTLEDACTYLVGPVIAFVLRLRGATCLHASCIAVGGRAIALLGQPGAGKSTTAAAFAQLGYSILSDDVAVLDDRGDGFLVQPGYPRVNLWPDSVGALFGSEDALPNISPTWNKRYLPLDQNAHRFQASPLPLGGIYTLANHESGLAAPVVEELGASEAFMTLVANTYVNYVLNAEMRSREFEVLGRVVAEVPVRRVRAAGDPSRLFDLCEVIVADAGQFENWDVRTRVMNDG